MLGGLPSRNIYVEPDNLSSAVVGVAVAFVVAATVGVLAAAVVAQVQHDAFNTLFFEALYFRSQLTNFLFIIRVSCFFEPEFAVFSKFAITMFQEIYAFSWVS